MLTVAFFSEGNSATLQLRVSGANVETPCPSVGAGGVRPAEMRSDAKNRSWR